MKEHTTLITPEKLIKQKIAHKIVESQATKLSALSWNYFSKKRQGRGYLYIHKYIGVEHIAGNDFDISENDSFIKDILYFAKGSDLWNYAKESEKNSGQEHEFEEFYNMVDEYNPKLEFLVFVGIDSTDNEVKPIECYFRIQPKIPPYKARLIK